MPIIMWIGKVQEIADYVGDSYYLAELAAKVSQSVIIFCGVSFMGESAKILNPGKRVVMADRYADCPMAHMVDLERIREVRREHPDAAVVCYVNSTAEIKSESDVCVTSSNAVKIVRKLPNKKIFFIPDNNLGRYVAKQLPEKQFIFHDGFCHVHKSIHKEEVLKAKEVILRHWYLLTRSVRKMCWNWQILSEAPPRSSTMPQILMIKFF